MGPAGTGAVSRGAAATALAAYTDGTTGISLVITHASTAETPTATGDRSTVETDATAAETSVKTDARRVLMKVVRKGKVSVVRPAMALENSAGRVAENDKAVQSEAADKGGQLAPAEGGATPTRVEVAAAAVQAAAKVAPWARARVVKAVAARVSVGAVAAKVVAAAKVAAAARAAAAKVVEGADKRV